MARSKARYVVSRIRVVLQRNKELLKDVEVKKLLRLTYPLLIEYGSGREKEFFKSLYPDLFEES